MANPLLLPFARGAIKGVEVTDLEVIVFDNHISATGVSLEGKEMDLDINFAHGNMSCWKSDKSHVPHTIAIWQEECLEDGCILASESGILMDVEGDWEGALKLYGCINDLVTYDPSYFL